MKNNKKLISILLSITIIVFFPLLSICQNHKNYFYENPYEICLTPGENETMVNFSWYSNENKDNQLAIWAELGNKQIYKSKTKELEDRVINNQVTVKNLKDNKIYYYSFKIDGIWSEPIEFKTKNSKEFTFAFMGDPQIGASSKKATSFETGIKKDVLNWTEAINKALEKNNNLSFIICAGDETNTKEDKNNSEKINISNLEYLGFLSPSYLKYIPIANAIGNHDKDNINFKNHFYMPNESDLGETAAGADYYFTYGNTIFLFLNSNNLDIKDHEKFIKEALEKNEKIKWKIAVFHHDIYGGGSHKDDKDVKQLRETLPAILDKNKIDLVLCGHDHIYSRTYALKDNKKVKENCMKKFDDSNETIEIINNPKGIIYITGGTCTGSKFYKTNGEKEKYVKFKYDNEECIYTMISISENEIIIETYKINNDEMIDNKIIINKNNDLA